MSNSINDRIWEECAELVSTALQAEELARLADADDLDGAWNLLRELRVQS